MKDKIIPVSIQGFEGSYSHQVVKEIFEKNNLKFDLLENSTFKSAFEKIRKNNFGIIPVENSTAGFVYQAIDEIIKNDFEIVGEYFLDINHVLLGKKNSELKKIKKVFSHDQALMQTSDFLEKNKIEAVDFGDTAGGAKFISENENLENSALGSKILSEIYNLDILAENINNEENNKTRFLLISKKGNKKFFLENLDFKEEKTKHSLVFEVFDESGSLLKILEDVAKNNLNLINLFSRPVSGEEFSYQFFVEFFTRKEEEEILKIFSRAKKVHYLGSYKMVK